MNLIIQIHRVRSQYVYMLQYMIPRSDAYFKVPSATYQQDTVWLRVGMATRMALDLSLHVAGTPAYKPSSATLEPWRIASVSPQAITQCCSKLAGAEDHSNR